ncbi:MAG TPA: hypothetical protein VF796_03265, partial [Humisphaera sp.]
VPVEVDAPSYRRAGLRPEAPVTVRVRGALLADVLNELSAAEHSPTTLPGWTIRDGRVVIGAWGDDDATVRTTRLYDVRDLVAAAATMPAVGRASCFELPGERPTPIIEDLVRLITESIAPDTWRDNGGTGGSIRPYGGRLIVWHRPDGHRQVRRLLALLREPPAAPTPPPPAGPPVFRWNPRLAKWVDTDDRVAEAKLDRPIPEFRAAGPRREVLAAWAKAADIDLLIDPAPAAAATPDAPAAPPPDPLGVRVTVDLWSAPAGEVLRDVLAGSGLTWRYDGSAVVVVHDSRPGQRDPDRVVVTRVLDIRDWLAAAEAVEPPAQRSSAAERAGEDLIRYLQRVVDPDSWRDNGGVDGSATMLARRLIVSQTPPNQWLVRRAIDEVRRTGLPATRPAATPATRPGG